jgi:hypothetical protein
MPKKLENVSIAIERNKEVLARVAATGMEHELAYFPVMELPEPIRFYRGRMTATHIMPAAFAIGGDRPDLGYHGIRGQKVDIEPTLSFRLQEGAVAASGIISMVRYKEFSLGDWQFQGGTPDISGLLAPAVFAVAPAEEQDGRFIDGPVYGGSPIEVGSNADKGDLAIFTSRVLDAAAVLLGGYDQQQLIQISGVDV